MSTALTNAKSRELAYSKALNQSKIDIGLQEVKTQRIWRANYGGWVLVVWPFVGLRLLPT